jgi:hypothetical protein
LESLDINGRIKLKLILSRMGCVLDSIRPPLNRDQLRGFFEHGNEVFGPSNTGKSVE